MIITIGLIALMFFFLWLAFGLQDQHFVLKVVGIVFAVLFALLLTNHMLNASYCEIVVVSENDTVVGADTAKVFGYERQCFGASTDAPFTAYKLVNYFVRYSPWYVFVFIIYALFAFYGIDLIKRAEQLFKGGRR